MFLVLICRIYFSSPGAFVNAVLSRAYLSVG